MSPRRYQSSQNDEDGNGSDNNGYLTLIRVKVSDNEVSILVLLPNRLQIHHQDDVRGMTMTTDITFSEFMAKVCSKFQKRAGELDLKFRDEDGAKITLRDESDFEMAIETSRMQAKGRPEGKLELFCREL